MHTDLSTQTTEQLSHTHAHYFNPPIPDCCVYCTGLTSCQPQPTAEGKGEKGIGQHCTGVEGGAALEWEVGLHWSGRWDYTGVGGGATLE